jgi:hypothetical protein
MTQRGFFMRSHTFIQSTAAALFLCLLASVAQSGGEEVETGWLELVKGSRGDIIGAELVDIEEGDSADTQKITVAIPKASVGNPGDIEEVLVIGQKPPEAEKSKPVEYTYEWVTDYDSDNYGLVIRLGKNTNWPIRLFMSSDAGFIR